MAVRQTERSRGNNLRSRLMSNGLSGPAWPVDLRLWARDDMLVHVKMKSRSNERPVYLKNDSVHNTCRRLRRALVRRSLAHDDRRPRENEAGQGLTSEIWFGSKLWYSVVLV